MTTKKSDAGRSLNRVLYTIFGVILLLAIGLVFFLLVLPRMVNPQADTILLEPLPPENVQRTLQQSLNSPSGEILYSIADQTILDVYDIARDRSRELDLGETISTRPVAYELAGFSPDERQLLLFGLDEENVQRELYIYNPNRGALTGSILTRENITETSYTENAPIAFYENDHLVGYSSTRSTRVYPNLTEEQAAAVAEDPQLAYSRVTPTIYGLDGNPVLTLEPIKGSWDIATIEDLGTIGEIMQFTLRVSRFRLDPNDDWDPEQAIDQNNRPALATRSAEREITYQIDPKKWELVDSGMKIIPVE